VIRTGGLTLAIFTQIARVMLIENAQGKELKALELSMMTLMIV